MPAPAARRDIWAHHAWADAEHWRVFEAFPAVFLDAALFERLHHIHLSQRAWVWAIGDRGREFTFSTPGDFTPAALKDFAIGNHQALAVIATLGDSELERQIDIPWFRDPPFSSAWARD